MSGVWARISTIGVRTSLRSAMKMRGMSGKWNAMWNSSPSPKYGRTSGGHWFASASSMRSEYVAVDLGAHVLEEGVRLRQVLAVGAVALEQIRDGVHAQAVDASIEPEAHDAQHLLLDGGLSKLRSGWWLKKRCQKYCRATGSQVQFEASVSVKMMRASA